MSCFGTNIEGMKFEITFRDGENLHEIIGECGIIDWIAKNIVLKQIAKTNGGKIWQGHIYVVNEKSFGEIVEESEAASRTIKRLEE